MPAKLSGSDYDIGWITPVGGSGYSDEQAQDAVGSILLDSATIDFTYDDAANSMTAAVKFQQSIAADASGLKLAGDSAAPGALKLYGTDAAGAKGWYAQLSGGAGGSFAFVDVI